MAAMLQGNDPKLALRYSHLYGQYMGSLPDTKLRISVLVAAECISLALDISVSGRTQSARVYGDQYDCLKLNPPSLSAHTHTHTLRGHSRPLRLRWKCTLTFLTAASRVSVYWALFRA